MKSSAKRISRLALLTAVSVVFLVLANVLPAGRLVLLAAASFPVCMSLMMYGKLWALGVFLVTTVLGALIIPGTSSVLYAAFFGYYPILKSILEKLHQVGLVWLLKYALYTAVFILYAALATSVLGVEVSLPWLVLYAAGGAAFFVYDYCYSILIRFYIEKIARYFP